MKKILVLNANPKSSSFCHAIAQTYVAAVGDQVEVELLHLANLQFQLDLHEGYDKPQALEADLVRVQQLLLWADHLVLICPVWWGGMPAKLKGLFDRVLLSGFAFKYHQGQTVPEKLLRGRSAELVLTLDTPVFWYKWWQRQPVYYQLTRTILDFVGIKNQATHYVGPVISADAAKRAGWLRQIQQLARRRSGR